MNAFEFANRSIEERVANNIYSAADRKKRRGLNTSP